MYRYAEANKIDKNGDKAGDQSGYTAIKNRYDDSTANIATLTAAAEAATTKVTETSAAADTASVGG